jgi:hypothetical protein
MKSHVNTDVRISTTPIQLSQWLVSRMRKGGADRAADGISAGGVFEVIGIVLGSRRPGDRPARSSRGPWSAELTVGRAPPFGQRDPRSA